MYLVVCLVEVKETCLPDFKKNNTLKLFCLIFLEVFLYLLTTFCSVRIDSKSRSR